MAAVERNLSRAVLVEPLMGATGSMTIVPTCVQRIHGGCHHQHAWLKTEFAGSHLLPAPLAPIVSTSTRRPFPGRQAGRKIVDRGSMWHHAIQLRSIR